MRVRAEPGLWVGGRFSSPFFITGEGEPYRPEVIVWMELPSGMVVGHRLIDPRGEPVPFAATLEEAMREPLMGPPRRPGRVRIADEGLAREIREADLDLSVELGATPELEELMEFMAEDMGPGDESRDSYFEDGRVPEVALRSLFANAEILYRIAPWKKAADTDVIRMDIPALGVRGACLSIIGALGESLGVLIFPSDEAFERFLGVSEKSGRSPGRLDLGTSVLSLEFERAVDLPPSMRREVMKHGWPVAGPEAYPRVRHRDRDGMPRPLTEKDLKIASACAASMASFFIKHEDMFAGDRFEPVCESWCDQDDLEVRLTAPYRAWPLFEANEPPAPARPAVRAGAKVGRNDPCPCGSGRKYKKCCLGKETAAGSAPGARPAPAGRAPSSLHELDQRLSARLLMYAERRFQDLWANLFEELSGGNQDDQLAGHLLAYHFDWQGKTLCSRFMEERGSSLSAREREWLMAQQESWLSVLEVQAVEPGRSITFRDLLTGHESTVREAGASRTLVRRDAVLGRIVELRGEALLCGCYHRPLPPVEAGELVGRARKRLRLKKNVPEERLRGEKICTYLLDLWEDALEEIDERFSRPPRMQNTDGDELLLTADLFEFDPADREEIERRISGLEWASSPGPDDEDRSISFQRPGNPGLKQRDDTVVGRAELTDGRLLLETNSIERAGALKKKVERACGDKIRFLRREHTDPVDIWKSRGERDRREEPVGKPLPPEAMQALIEYKRRHYEDWADCPMPALSGQTPREALETREGRQRVDALLKHMENQEARLPAGQAFDFSSLRSSLGL